MPAVHTRRTAGLRRTPRQGIPQPGQGGYGYPRGPFGATGYPGSAPAARPVHTQGPQGRKDPQFAGRPTLTRTQVSAQWAEVIGPDGQQVQAPARKLKFTTGPERRATPVIGGIGQEQPKTVRNSVAQRYKAVPGHVRSYQPAPNPGKTGAHLRGASQYHPGTTIHGDPDGKPVPGNPGTVTVPSRYVSREGSQEDYAMNRPMLFAKGGTPAAQPRGAAPHIRGGRYSGSRYFGPVSDQQQIGLDTDAFGVARRRGPRHRPVRFEQPEPWTAAYYDVPPKEGQSAPDMIHQAPAGRRASSIPRRGGTGTGRRRG